MVLSTPLDSCLQQFKHTVICLDWDQQSEIDEFKEAFDKHVR